MTDDTAGMGACRCRLCRYPHTVNVNGGGTSYHTANQSGRVYTAIGLSRYVQVGDGDITHLGEEGSIVAATLDIDVDGVAVSAKGAMPGRIAEAH